MPTNGLPEVIEMIEQKRVPTAEADVATTAERAPGRRLLELLASRDFERLAATLASGVHARFLLPHGLEELLRPRRHRRPCQELVRIGVDVRPHVFN